MFCACSWSSHQNFFFQHCVWFVCIFWNKQCPCRWLIGGNTKENSAQRSQMQTSTSSTALKVGLCYYWKGWGTVLAGLNNSTFILQHSGYEKKQKKKYWCNFTRVVVGVKFWIPLTFPKRPLTPLSACCWELRVCPELCCLTPTFQFQQD